ncbi:hypothetical protein C8F01DRAFT_1258588 [Mycena amicta]|nr:hypothetical protein C8F01DRAFT_1258588 [Mycena amicta]
MGIGAHAKLENLGADGNSAALLAHRYDNDPPPSLRALLLQQLVSARSRSSSATRSILRTRIDTRAEPEYLDADSLHSPALLIFSLRRHHADVNDSTPISRPRVQPIAL